MGMRRWCVVRNHLALGPVFSRAPLHWDASYKEAKHLGRYHSESIFRALITATNENMRSEKSEFNSTS